ncbi:MAG: RagB/SusD family nutrient uptake outer membrane protein [Paludibacteraceae bacterium]|nr:RagB/SusD family nutrient uptake outer membrane protein [Paludibacteraceae bacterium]
MKKLYYIFALAAVTLAASSCADSYLNREPGGSSITEAQYQRMDNVTEGTVKGVYTLLYEYGGEHDAFAQRSFDMYGDLLSGDMALKTQNYGWFSTDELGQTYTRRATFWNYYYGIIRICNKALNAIDAQYTEEEIQEALVNYSDATEEMMTMLMYTAEIYTMRGWAYAGLSRYFVSPTAGMNDLAVPIYTEQDTKADTILGAPRASVGDLYLRIEEDFMQAIQIFEVTDLLGIERTNKIETNADIARISLAYSYLNKGDNANAYKWATEAISKTTATLLPNEEVLTTGFNDISSNNWIWGKDVTVDNTTSLASFFGQCDIYSYSYAGAGDVKGIDKNLYDQIQAWDIRKFWWNNYATSGQKNASTYEYAPDGKFYSAKLPQKLKGDRDWLSDDVYMRLELAYLIAAEAAARLGDYTNAKNYLFAITDQRVLPTQESVYEDWKNNLSDGDLLATIKHNWRVELWGEGYALQTFRRYQERVTLGDNHLRSNKELDPSTARVYTFEIPTSEEYYNPYLRIADVKNLHVKN